jgi:hypothetical protein
MPKRTLIVPELDRALARFTPGIGADLQLLPLS